MAVSDLSYIAPQLRSFAQPVDSFTPDPKNARKHGDRNRQALKDSIERSGFRSLIVAQRKGSELIVRVGNNRLGAVKELGHTHIPALIFDEGDDEAVAYAIADNQTAALGEWDNAVLAEILGDQEKLGVDLGTLGFDDMDIQGICNALEIDSLGSSPAAPSPSGGGTPPPTPTPSHAPGSAEHHPTGPVASRLSRGMTEAIGPHTLTCDDCVAVMDAMAEDSIDAVVTDPPYGLSPDGKARTWDELEKLRAEGKGPKGGFMGKDWDAGVPGLTWARSLFRVMKPGAHAVIFSANRTIHRLTCALEDAGFEVRDQIGWLQWQGFPKSTSVAREIDRHLGAEREVVATERRYNEPSGIVNAGRGAEARTLIDREITVSTTEEAKAMDGWGTALKPASEPAVLVRKPLVGTIAQNVLSYGTGALNIDACRIAPGDPSWPGPNAEVPVFDRPDTYENSSYHINGNGPSVPHPGGRWPANVYATPKASRGEREEGCESLDPTDREAVTGRKPDSAGGNHARAGITAKGDIRNYHPTVKPRRLIEWLVMLVTPEDGVVLDPFAGSGTIFVAASGAQRRAVGIELDPGHCDIAYARAEASLPDESE